MPSRVCVLTDSTPNHYHTPFRDCTCIVNVAFRWTNRTDGGHTVSFSFLHATCMPALGHLGTQNKRRFAESLVGRPAGWRTRLLAGTHVSRQARFLARMFIGMHVSRHACMPVSISKLAPENSRASNAWSRSWRTLGPASACGTWHRRLNGADKKRQENLPRVVPQRRTDSSGDGAQHDISVSSRK